MRMTIEDKKDPPAESGEIIVHSSGDVVIGAPTATVVVTPTEDSD
jgi:hypothetical protein